MTLIALDVCQAFVDALVSGYDSLDLYYLACKASMKQELGEIVSFNCNIVDRFGWCEFEVEYE